MRFFSLLAATGVALLCSCADSGRGSLGDLATPPSTHPERRGISLLPLSAPSGAEASAAPVLEGRRSFAVTDEAILQRFSFEEVMEQLTEQGRVLQLTPLRLYQEWWDSQRKAPGLGLGGPHCDDQLLGDGSGGLNGFSYACPRAEGNQAKEDPFETPQNNPAAYLPIGLFNRFDLAARDGSDCGEYRIVFARRSGLTQDTSRNFISFESVLPNPQPALGLRGCREVALFWAGLSQEPNVGKRARALHDFFFKGVGGLPPALHIDHLGNATDRPTGQVRTNQFMQALWTLREFRVRKQCAANKGCMLRFVPDTVKSSVAGVLFNPKASHALQGDFAQFLTAQLGALSVNDMFRFNLDGDERFHGAQSRSSGTDDLYSFQFGKGPSPLRTQLQARLEALGSPLTPNQIVARAQTLSCAGCHQSSTGVNLGGGLRWPTKSNAFEFVHVSERVHELGPDGPRYGLSEALEGVFLPFRMQLMAAFLSGGAPFDTLEAPADEARPPAPRAAPAPGGPTAQ